MPSRNRVFVSYSHKDKRIFEDFRTMLAPALEAGRLDLWSDQEIPVGGRWSDAIERALASANVAVLLVSQNFLASHFIASNELPPLLDAAINKGVTIFWVFISSCLYKETEIARYQAAHDISRPLDRLSKSQRQAALSDICAKLVGIAALPQSATSSPSLSALEPENGVLRDVEAHESMLANAPQETSVRPPQDGTIADTTGRQALLGTEATHVTSAVCPYRGLLSFTEADAGLFFGREELIEELTERLRNNPKLLAVIGSSGSGKSSVVRAGLIPHLNATPGFRNAQVLYFRPGHTPLDELGKVVARAVTSDLNADPADVMQRISSLSKVSRVVMLADQFEEAFALSPNLERVRFIECLSDILETNHNVTLLLTLRADFYDQLLRSQLGQRVKYGQVTVLPLSTKELHVAITKPAESVGLELDPGLAERILEDCMDVEQPLPLLEFALTQLWERREEKFLTHKAYTGIGRVAGALSSWATDAYDSLGSDCEVVRRLFTSLVHFGKNGAPDTRRRVSFTDLSSVSTDTISLHRIVMYLASRRLLVTDRDISTEDSYVEIVHDALLSEWELLRSWIREDHPFLSWRQRLDEHAQEWLQKQRDLGTLLRGQSLLEALQRLDSRRVDLSALQVEYIQQSLEQRDQEQARFEQLSNDAARGREETLQQRQISVARDLASQAESMRTRHPELVERGVLLALESIKRFRTVEADQALRRWLNLLPRRISRVQHDDEVRCVAFSPNGRFLATGGNDCTVIVSEVQTGRELARILHKGEVTSVQFSPDSSIVASASNDCTVYLVRLKTGERICEIGHEFQVYSVEFSPDGSMVATASMDKTAGIWQVKDGQKLHSLDHDDQVGRATWSPDGKRVGTGSWDSSCRIWDVATGRLLSCFKHGDRVTALVFGPDGTIIVTGSLDRSARVWDIAHQRELGRMLHAGEVSDIALSSDGKLLASASWDCTVRIWEVESGIELTRLSHDGNVYTVVFSPNQQFVATAGLDNMARLFNPITGSEVARMTHESRVHAIEFSSDSKMLASASADHSARVWEAGTGSATPMMIHEDGVYDLRFSADGTLLATASMDSTGRVWEALSGRELLRFRHNAGVNVVEFSRDGRMLATASMDCTLRIWDIPSGSAVFDAEHEFQIYAVDFSPDRRLVASASMDRTARIWDAATGREVIRLQHSDQVNCVKFSADGRLLVTASSDCAARVWEVSTGSEVARLVHGDAVKVAFFKSDGTSVLTASADRTARLWTLKDCAEVARFLHEDAIYAISLSPDEGTLATASWDRSVRTWSLSDGNEMRRFMHERQVCAVCFDPKGEFVASASWDRTARIWELSSGREIARLEHDERILSVSFSPDGHYIATGSMDGTCRLHFWQTPDLIEYASRRVNRILTNEERRLYLGSEAGS